MLFKERLSSQMPNIAYSFFIHENKELFLYLINNNINNCLSQLYLDSDRYPSDGLQIKTPLLEYLLNLEYDKDLSPVDKYHNLIINLNDNWNDIYIPLFTTKNESGVEAVIIINDYITKLLDDNPTSSPHNTFITNFHNIIDKLYPVHDKKRRKSGEK